MHDFRQLSPPDFENLVRDLLQEELKLRIESFGPGKDGGVDFRFAKAGLTTVIQVKHYVDTPARELVRAAAKENEKVARLKPDRYIFVTSASLTPALKDKIIAAMPNAPLTRDDVLGREDINNQLELYPKILQRHFKLWLTHAATLERIVHSGIYNRTDAELDLIKSLVPRFVQNRSIEAAEEILRSRGTLIIAGEPGVGKTTLARVLTWLHLDQGWHVFVVDDLKEAMEVCTTGEKRLIFFDDFLGQISLTNDAIRNVDQRLPAFLERVRNDKNLRFVLTTRSYLLSQAQQQSTRLASEKVIASELLLNVGTYTRSIRAQIVYNHIYFSDLNKEEKLSLLNEEFYLRMIDHQNFSPRLIELLTTADYLALQYSPIREVVLRVLDNPAVLWETPYRSHLTEDSRIAMLALFFNGNFVSTEDLLQSFKHFSNVVSGPMASLTEIARFRQALKPLEGPITSHSNDYVYFSNPGLKDFLSNVIIEDHLLPLVVQVAGSFDELNNAFEFYKKNRDVCRRHMPNEDVWSTALSRLMQEVSIHTIKIVSLGLSMCIFLETKQAAFRTTEQALQLLSHAVVEAIDEMYFRQALERLHQLSIEEQKSLPSRGALAYSAARMLGGCGKELSIEDIQAVAQSIDVYGEEPHLAKTAVGFAMAEFLEDLDDILWEHSEIGELDSFEEILTKLRKVYGFPSAPSEKRKILEYREYLERKEDEDEEERYVAVNHSQNDSDITDAGVKSLFETLR